MIAHQDARRNLSPGELIYANSMVAEEIALENKERKVEGGRAGADVTNGKTACVQMDASRERSTNTREQVAKMSGVGAGTVARYDGQDMPIMAAGLTAKGISHTIKIGRRYRSL